MFCHGHGGDGGNKRNTGQRTMDVQVVCCVRRHIIRSDMLVLAGLPLAPGQSAVYRAARAIRRPRSKGAVSLSLAAVQVEETLHATVPSAASCCGVRSRIISSPPRRSWWASFCRECSHTLREQRCLPADLPHLSWSRILPSFPPSPCEYLPVVGCLLSKRV